MGPTPENEARINQAVIQKATRVLMLAETPLGVWGELSDVGVASVRPDYPTVELVKGLRYQGFDVADITADLTEADVIRQGLQTDPATFPTDRLGDVTRALQVARDWVSTELAGLGVA